MSKNNFDESLGDFEEFKKRMKEEISIPKGAFLRYVMLSSLVEDSGTNLAKGAAAFINQHFDDDSESGASLRDLARKSPEDAMVILYHILAEHFEDFFSINLPSDAPHINTGFLS